MNCGICSAYLRDERKCPGCKKAGQKFHATCIIKNCDKIKKIRFCSDKCEKYPCQRLKSLDKRYRTKYGMSMIENLENIRKNGIRKFINKEKKRWIKGNKIFCVHNKKYYG